MNETSEGQKPPRRAKARRPKVAPFARYRGTSAWHKDRKKMRAYARFKADAKRAGQAVAPAPAV